MIPITAALLAAAAVVFTLLVRAKDLPAPEPESPTKHLEERKATIYENLRDLQFEYRVGKLSDADYQATKQDLQKELAVVLAEIDKLEGGRQKAEGGRQATRPSAVIREAIVCPHCGAKLPQAMKFCGECGKAMVVEVR